MIRNLLLALIAGVLFAIAVHVKSIDCKLNGPGARVYGDCSYEGVPDRGPFTLDR